MPINGELKHGRKRNVVIQLKGPRTKAEQMKLKKELKKLLAKHRGVSLRPKKKR